MDDAYHKKKGFIANLEAEVKKHPLLSKAQEQELGKEIFYYKRMIVGLLSFLPDYEGCLFERLVEASEAEDAAARTHIIVRVPAIDKVIKERLSSCVNTVRKINYCIDSDGSAVSKKEHRIDLLNEFRYTNHFIKELVADLKNADLPGRYSKVVGLVNVIYDCYREARADFSNANLRLVASIAKKHENRGVPVSDLVEEGVIGLINSLDRYDHTRNLKFSTYATWWVRQAITRAIGDKARTVRLPIHVLEMMSKLNKARRRLYERGIDRPSFELLAEESGLSLSDVKNVSRKVCKTPLSLDLPVGEDEESANILNYLEDKNSEKPYDSAQKVDLKERIHDVLETLTERERDVLKFRFGLCGSVSMTLEQIAGIFSLTRERIRQIEAKALRKLNHPTRSSRLEDFLEKVLK